MKRLKALSSFLKPEMIQYEGNQLVLKVASMPKLFKTCSAGYGFGKNDEDPTDPDIFQLGWDTLAVLKIEHDRFVINEIMNFHTNEKNVEKWIGKSYSQIVTHAVDTCCFIYLKTDDMIIIAHLDKPQLEKAFPEIVKRMPPQDRTEGLCSMIVDDDPDQIRQRFKEKVIANYPMISLLIRPQHIHSEPIKRYTHFEIGIYFNDNTIDVFGDYTLFFPLKSDEQKAKTYLFSSLLELQEIQNQITDTSCIII